MSVPSLPMVHARRRGSVLLVMVLVGVQVLAACGSPATDALQPGEVTLQPDVVTVSGGADAIRSRSPDGLTWTIKAGAPGADQLVPGKVMFVTGLAVGRVLAVRSSNGDRVVTLGPASITDVIQDGDIASSQPVAIGNMTAYTAPQMPGTAVGGSASDTTASDACTGTQCGTPTVRLMSTANSVASDGATFVNTCCDGTIGPLYAKRPTQGIHMVADMQLLTASPHVTYDLRFRYGALRTGSLRVTGITGLHFDVRAATPPGAPTNLDQVYQLPLEFKLPTTGTATGTELPPLYVTLSETLEVITFFTAGDAVLQGEADYSFTGSTLGVSVAPDNNGHYTTARYWMNTAPTGFTVVKASLLNTIAGYSVGPAGLAMLFGAQFCICFGSFLSDDGLYVKLNTELGLVNDSSAVAALGGRCHGAHFYATTRYGLGHYLHPQTADWINSYLRQHGASPVEQSSGFTERKSLWDASQTVPNTIDYTRCGGQ